MDIMFFFLLSASFADLIPTIQNIPPVSVVCTPFELTILAIDSATGLAGAAQMTVFANILTQNGTVYLKKSCVLANSSGCVVSGLKFGTSGSFYCSVTNSNNIVLSKTPSFVIASLVNTMQASSSISSPSTFEDFSIDVTLFDLCGNLAEQTALVSLSVNMSLIGNLSGTTSIGDLSLPLYSQVTGYVSIAVSCFNLSQVINLTILQGLLMFTRVDPIPTIEFSVVNLTVKILSNSASAIISNHGPFPVTLSLNPPSSMWSGPVTNTSVNGVIEFTNVTVNASGIFQFFANATGIIGGASSNYTFEPAVITTLVTNSTVITSKVNFVFQVNVTAFDQISRLWFKDCNIIAVSDSSLLGVTNLTTTKGFIMFDLYFNTSGNRLLNFTSMSGNVSVPANISKALIKITKISPNPTLTLHNFSVSVSVSNGTVAETKNGVYNLTISSVPKYCLTGVSTVTTVAGIATFVDLQFNTTGLFKLNVNGDDLVTGISQTLYLIALVLSSIDVKVPVITVDFYFVLGIQLKDQFGNPWNKTANITLVSAEPVSGATFNSTENGFSSFNLSYSKTGICNISVLSGEISQNISLNVSGNSLKMYYPGQGIAGFSYYILDQFWVSVAVMDSSGQFLYDIDGINVTMLVTNKGNIIRPINKFSVKGFSNFSLVFESLGSYFLQFSCPNCVTASLLIPEIVYGPVSSILLTVPPVVFARKYRYDFSITLLNTTQKTIPYNAEFFIYNTNNQLVYSDWASFGSANFSLFFNTTGLNRLTIKTHNTSQSLELEVSESNNTDIMCLVAAGSNSCLYCASQANEIINGTCRCVLNSQFYSNVSSCLCDPPLRASSGFCVSCGNYLKNSEVSASFSASYKSISLIFNQPISFSALQSCADILVNNSTYLAKDPKCTWTRPTQLDISFSHFLDLSSQVIQINSTSVTKSQGNCSFTVEVLLVPIRLKHPLPALAHSVNGPDIYSITCSPGDLLFRSSVFSVEYCFEWKLLSSSSDDLKDFVDNTSTSFLSIPRSLINTDLIQVSLVVSVPALSISSESQKTTRITRFDSIGLHFNIGSFFTATVGQLVFVEVLSSSICSWSIPVLTWTSNIPNFNSLLQTSKSNTQLVIPSNTLKASKVYSIQASADGLAIETSIKILPSDLVIILSKSSGKIPLNYDLEVSVSAKDPDDSSAQFFYSWKCSQNFNPCLDFFGEEISYAKNQKSLKIPSHLLVSSMTYRIDITVEGIYKAASSFIYLTVDSDLKGVISIPYSRLNIIENQILTVIPYYKYNDSSIEFFWTVNGGYFNPGSSSLTQPFFCALGRQFKKGLTYQIELNILTQNGFKTTGGLSIYVFAGPDCKDFIVEYGNPGYLAAKDCWDIDDQNYPIFYQFGAVLESPNMTYFFTNLGLSFEYFGDFLIGNGKVFAKVCTSSFMCKMFYSRLRGLQSVSPSFIQQVDSGKNIPNLILALKGQALNDTMYSRIFNGFLLYFHGMLVDQESFGVLLGCIEALGRYENFNQTYFEKSFELVNETVANFDYVISDEEMSQLFYFLYTGLNYLKIDDFFSSVSLLLDKKSSVFLPGYSYQYSKDFTAYFQRAFSSQLNNSLIDLPDFSLYFPEDLSINSTEVADFKLIVVNYNKSYFIHTSLKKTGVYSNFNLEQLSPEASTFALASPLTLKIFNEAQYSSSKCTDSSDQISVSCKVLSSKTETSLLMSSLGTYSISASSSCSNDMNSLVLGLSIFIVSHLYASTVFFSNSKAPDLFPFYKFFLFIPLFSAFISQPLQNRLTSISIFCSALLNLLVLNRVTALYLLPPAAFEIYSSKDLVSGLISLALHQPIIFCLLKLQVSFRSSSLNKLPLLVSAAFSVVSTSLLIAIYFLKCEPSSSNWLLNFIIFVLLETLLLHPAYSYFISRSLKFFQYPQTRVHTLADDLQKSQNIQVLNLESREEPKLPQTSPNLDPSNLGHLFNHR